MPTYFIKLTPCDTFFFGRSQYSELGNRQNYFTTSSMFPQQTTLLGMLRFQLLKQRGCLYPSGQGIENAEEAQRLTGPESFPSNSYGIINQISPLFLVQEQEVFYLRNHAVAVNQSGGNEPTYHPSAILSSSEGTAQNLLSGNDTSPALQPAFKFKDFEAKYGWQEKLVSQNQEEREIKDIFFESIRAHNHKQLRGTSLEQGFFKERKYRLHEEYAFGCYVDFAEEKPLKNDFVRLGGRKSWFKMELTNIGSMPNFQSGWAGVKKHSQRYLLLSDTLLQPDYASHCIAVAGTSVPFRNLKTYTDTKTNYYKMTEQVQQNTPYLTKYRFLLERGSVLWLKDDSKMEDLIDQTQHRFFSKIGYNHFISIAPLK